MPQDNLEQQIEDAQRACNAYYHARNGIKLVDMWKHCSPVEQNAWHAVVLAVRGGRT